MPNPGGKMSPEAIEKMRTTRRLNKHKKMLEVRREARQLARANAKAAGAGAVKPQKPKASNQQELFSQLTTRMDAINDVDVTRAREIRDLNNKVHNLGVALAEINPGADPEGSGRLGTWTLRNELRILNDKFKTVWDEIKALRRAQSGNKASEGFVHHDGTTTGHWTSSAAQNTVAAFVAKKLQDGRFEPSLGVANEIARQRPHWNIKWPSKSHDRALRVCEMSDDHVRNALALLLRRREAATQRSGYYHHPDYWLPADLDEFRQERS